MANRIYYASHSVAIGGVTLTGVQSVGVSTTYNREPIFELGQKEVYLDQESIADVEVTISKLMDGTTPMYLLATSAGSSGSSGTDLSSRSESKCDVTLSTFDDVNGNHISTASMPDMYVSNISYTIPIDGNATEDITLVGNVKENAVSSGSSGGGANSAPASLGNRVIVRRQHVTLGSGLTGAQNITFSVDLSREPLYAFGSLLPTVRLVNYPIEVTTEVEYLASGALDGTASTATTGCQNYTAGGDATGALTATLCHYSASSGSSGSGNNTVISAGSSNAITSVNYSGGDAGGGNATVTISYRNYNVFTVTHGGA